jgi:hypothetical protein
MTGALVAPARRTPHHGGIGLLGAERQRRQHVGAEVDREDLDDRERQRDAKEHEREVGAPAPECSS